MLLKYPATRYALVCEGPDFWTVHKLKFVSFLNDENETFSVTHQARVCYDRWGWKNMSFERVAIEAFLNKWWDADLLRYRPYFSEVPIHRFLKCIVRCALDPCAMEVDHQYKVKGLHQFFSRFGHSTKTIATHLNRINYLLSIDDPYKYQQEVLRIESEQSSIGEVSWEQYKEELLTIEDEYSLLITDLTMRDNFTGYTLVKPRAAYDATRLLLRLVQMVIDQEPFILGYFCRVFFDLAEEAHHYRGRTKAANIIKNMGLNPNEDNLYNQYLARLNREGREMLSQHAKDSIEAFQYGTIIKSSIRITPEEKRSQPDVESINYDEPEE